MTNISISDIYKFIDDIKDVYKCSNDFIEKISNETINEEVVNMKLKYIQDFINDNKCIDDELVNIIGQRSKVEAKHTELVNIQEQNAETIKEIVGVYEEKKQVISNVYNKVNDIKSYMTNIKHDVDNISRTHVNNVFIIVNDENASIGIAIPLKLSNLGLSGFRIDDNNKLMYIGDSVIDIVIRFEIVSTNIAHFDCTSVFQIKQNDSKSYPLSGVCKTVNITLQPNDYLALYTTSSDITTIKSSIISIKM